MNAGDADRIVAAIDRLEATIKENALAESHDRSRMMREASFASQMMIGTFILAGLAVSLANPPEGPIAYALTAALAGFGLLYAGRLLFRVHQTHVAGPKADDTGA